MFKNSRYFLAFGIASMLVLQFQNCAKMNKFTDNSENENTSYNNKGNDNHFSTQIDTRYLYIDDLDEPKPLPPNSGLNFVGVYQLQNIQTNLCLQFKRVQINQNNSPYALVEQSCNRIEVYAGSKVLEDAFWIYQFQDDQRYVICNQEIYFDDKTESIKLNDGFTQSKSTWGLISYCIPNKQKYDYGVISFDKVVLAKIDVNKDVKDGELFSGSHTFTTSNSDAMRISYTDGLFLDVDNGRLNVKKNNSHTLIVNNDKNGSVRQQWRAIKIR